MPFCLAPLSALQMLTLYPGNLLRGDLSTVATRGILSYLRMVENCRERFWLYSLIPLCDDLMETNNSESNLVGLFRVSDVRRLICVLILDLFELDLWPKK